MITGVERQYMNPPCYTLYTRLCLGTMGEQNQLQRPLNRKCNGGEALCATDSPQKTGYVEKYVLMIFILSLPQVGIGILQ